MPHRVVWIVVCCMFTQALDVCVSLSWLIKLYMCIICIMVKALWQCNLAFNSLNKILSSFVYSHYTQQCNIYSQRDGGKATGWAGDEKHQDGTKNSTESDERGTVEILLECWCDPTLMSRNFGKPMLWILTRSDTNQAVQPLEMAGSLKFGI